jgi:hypothetical protein
LSSKNCCGFIKMDHLIRVIRRFLKKNVLLQAVGAGLITMAY